MNEEGDVSDVLLVVMVGALLLFLLGGAIVFMGLTVADILYTEECTEARPYDVNVVRVNDYFSVGVVCECKDIRSPMSILFNTNENYKADGFWWETYTKRDEYVKAKYNGIQGNSKIVGNQYFNSSVIDLGEYKFIIKKVNEDSSLEGYYVEVTRNE